VISDYAQRSGQRACEALLGLGVLLAIAGANLAAAAIAQWDFDGDLAATTTHAALGAASALPAPAPAVTFEDTTLRGAPAQVARFSRGTYFRVRPGLAANGGGRYVNQYTVILDVLFPDRSPSGGWAALVQTNDANSNDADWFVDPAGRVGISGSYGGSVPEGEWRRLALVVDLVAGTLTSYVDGARVQELGAQALDGRFSLYSTLDGAREGFLLFADEDGDNAEGLIDALQVRDAALCSEDVAALGSFASGPLLPQPIAPHICAPGEPPPLAIKEGPYLQWATESEVTVMWETTVAADSSVSFRRQGGGWEELLGPDGVRIHEVRLRGLGADEPVEYFVRSARGADEVVSEAATFRTNPAQAVPFRFVIWGDNQANPPVFTSLVQGMTSRSPDLGVAVGDVVDNGDEYASWGRELLTPLWPLAKAVPFYVAIGNHERNSHWFYDYLAQPGNEHWFSFDYAGCHFVIVDSNFPFGPGSEQYVWLREDLFSEAAQGARWLFTFHHHPPYSEIYEEVIYERLRQHLVPLYEAAGVDINFTGHIHDYERGVFVPPDTGRRIVYLQTSGAGGRLWDDEFGGDWDEIERVIQYVHHYCEVTIEGETLELRAIDLQGRVIDAVTLTELPRGSEPPPPPPAPGQAVTQWDFETASLAASFGPGVLDFLGGREGETAGLARFGTTASFGLAPIGGEASGVIQFPRAGSRGIGFRVEPRAPGNGGGAFVNEYTLVLDFLIPDASFASDSWLSLYNTNAENANDGDLFVDLGTGGFGISGQYHGRVRPDMWHRLAAVFRRGASGVELRKFLDGSFAGAQDLGPPDGRWSLYSVEDATPWFLFLTDDDGESTEGYLSSFLFADRPLGDAEVAALGAPAAGGIFTGPCGADPCEPEFLRGDGNGDGVVDLSDAVFTLLYLFAGRAAPDCEKSLDADDNGRLELTDAVFTLGFLFRGGPRIRQPYPDCGVDPTADELACAGEPVCGL
jgi:hypothetical protein